MDVIQTLIVALTGMAAGFVASITAGAGIVAIPVLLFMGLPANEAIATNALATLGMLASSLPQYYRAKRIRWRTGTKLVPLAIVGGFIGSKALVRVDVDALSVVIGILLLFLIPVVLLNREKGLKDHQEGANKVVFGYLLYFLIMIYGGFLGAGAGVFAMYALVLFFGMTYIEAKATTSYPSVFLSVTALLVFLSHGLVDFKFGIPLLVGMYIGGAVGAKMALEKGDAWVRVLFIAVLAASAIKLLFFR